MKYIACILLLSIVVGCSHPGWYVKQSSCTSNAPGWLLCKEVKKAD